MKFVSGDGTLTEGTMTNNGDTSASIDGLTIDILFHSGRVHHRRNGIAQWGYRSSIGGDLIMSISTEITRLQDAKADLKAIWNLLVSQFQMTL